jgi:ADP-ribosyl-[dinitrogen reductase] hydrolase
MPAATQNLQQLQDRAQASLLGLALGDALGAAVEFLPRGRFQPLTGMVGGGKFRVAPGQWTDDTAMALCLADSLIACQGFDAQDQMRRYLRWIEEGYNASREEAFGIGKTVLEALLAFGRSGNPYSGRTESRFAGNGSLMRVAPIAIANLHSPQQAWVQAARSSQTTHGAAECVQACQYFTQLLIRAMHGASKADLLQPLQPQDVPELACIAHIVAGDYQHKREQDIVGSGYVVQSLEASLWAFWHTDSFKAAVLAAANLGDDADTTAAICGQLAGAHHGLAGLPGPWLQLLQAREHIAQRALALCDLAGA